MFPPFDVWSLFFRRQKTFAWIRENWHLSNTVGLKSSSFHVITTYRSYMQNSLSILILSHIILLFQYKERRASWLMMSFSSEFESSIAVINFSSCLRQVLETLLSHASQKNRFPSVALHPFDSLHPRPSPAAVRHVKWHLQCLGQ